MIVMDQKTRRIIGFAVHKGSVLAEDACSMLYAILPEATPKHLSTDNDPLFRSLLWKINIEEWGIDEVKSVPHQPWTHPFIERLIKSVRNEYLDRLFFWNDVDLQQKLNAYQEYFNNGRVHESLDAKIPGQVAEELNLKVANLKNYQYHSYCRGMFQVPIAA
jgi:putative transposase